MKQSQSLIAVLCVLLTLAPSTYAQNNAQESPQLETERPHWYSSLTVPYQPRTVPPVNVSNSGRLDSLLRAGKLYLSLSDAIESGRETDQLSAAVLTFDDGFADTFENGVPMFRRLGIPAHFYLATADIRRGWIPTSAGRAEAIRPSALRELAKDPLFTFGSHGHSHRVLLRLSDDEIRDELSTSKALVEEWTGGPALHFAYPKGLWDERVEAIVYLFK